MVLKLITRAGAFYTVGSEKVQGKEKLMQYFIDNPKIFDKLQKNIQEQINDLRMGKKVLEDEALDKIENILNEEDQSLENDA